MTTTSPGNPLGRDETPRCPYCESDIRRYAYGYIVFENEKKKQEFDQKFVMVGCTVRTTPHTFTAIPVARIASEEDVQGESELQDRTTPTQCLDQ